MRVGVKICGVSTPDALEACIEADADWVGFVFAPSPRTVSARQARGLIERLPTWIGAVGLFVRPTVAEIARVLDETGLAAIQVYDDAARVPELRLRFGLPVWHGCPVAAAEALPVRTNADRLVIEGSAAGSGRPGGNGARLDLSMLAGWTSPAEWMLAGGLTPGNVRDAVRETKAPAVDVSSGVENSPGLKDPRAILEFVTAARSAL